MKSSERDKLIARLEDESWEVRFFALKQIGASEEICFLDSALKMLDDPRTKVRRMAAWASGMLGNDTITETLITAMADPDEWVRVSIVEALERIGDRRMCLIISQFLENEEDEKVRATLIRVLGNLGDESMIPIISHYLNDSDSRVTANAIESLGKLSSESGSTGDSILAFLKHHDNRIKANTAKALWDMGQKDEAFSVLLEMLSSSNISMKASAAFMLGEIGATRSFGPLIDELANDTWIIRKNILSALIKLAPIDIPRLLLSADHSDPRVRTGIIFILGHFAHLGEVRKALIYALQDDEGSVRAKAEEALDRLDGDGDTDGGDA